MRSKGRVAWMYRKLMMRRAVKMVKAHWSKGVDWKDIERWYQQTLPRYAKISYGAATVHNYDGVMKAFLNEAIRLAEKRYMAID